MPGQAEALAENNPETRTVAWIDGEPVAESEYVLVMHRKKAEVFNHFKQQYNLDDHPGYWSDEGGTERPIQMLRKLVLEELAQIKVQQRMAREKGLIDDISYAAFRRVFDEENARRAAAVEANEVVHGPVQQTENAFYYVRFRDLAFRLKETLAKEFASEITMDEIEAYFHDNPTLFAERKLEEVRENIRKLLQRKRAQETIDKACAQASEEAQAA
jgi:hypothetical protein